MFSKGLIEKNFYKEKNKPSLEISDKEFLDIFREFSSGSGLSSVTQSTILKKFFNHFVDKSIELEDTPSIFDDLEKKKAGLSSVGKNISASLHKLLNEITIFWNNRHSISKQDITLIIAALLYFISPFDVVPDLLPGVGFLDDIVILTSLVAFIRKKYSFGDGKNFKEVDPDMEEDDAGSLRKSDAIDRASSETKIIPLNHLDKEFTILEEREQLKRLLKKEFMITLWAIGLFIGIKLIFTPLTDHAIGVWQYSNMGLGIFIITWYVIVAAGWLLLHRDKNIGLMAEIWDIGKQALSSKHFWFIALPLVVVLVYQLVFIVKVL